MKSHPISFAQEQNLEEIVSVCSGIPMGDELPQVAGVQDIVMDIYSDVLDVPRAHAYAMVHHQFDTGIDDQDMIH